MSLFKIFGSKIESYYQALKVVEILKDDLKGGKMSGGIKTSEFWVSLAGIIGTAYAGFGGFIPAALSAKIIAIVLCVYNVGRVVVKATATTKDDEFLDSIVNAVIGKINK